jgi:DNA-binding NarL/FixJ family response regulator
VRGAVLIAVGERRDVRELARAAVAADLWEEWLSSMKAGKRQRSARAVENGGVTTAPIPKLIHAAVGFLTEREIGVLGLRAKGLVYKEIADRLGISAHTVKNHLASVWYKLYATDPKALGGANRGRIF